MKLIGIVFIQPNQAIGRAKRNKSMITKFFMACILFSQILYLKSQISPYEMVA